MITIWGASRVGGRGGYGCELSPHTSGCPLSKYPVGMVHHPLGRQVPDVKEVSLVGTGMENRPSNGMFNHLIGSGIRPSWS